MAAVADTSASHEGAHHHHHHPLLDHDDLELPPPPNPSSDAGVIPPLTTPEEDAPSPPAQGEWDPSTLRPETAMKMLCRAVVALASATGDVPPTPPMVRPAYSSSNSSGSSTTMASMGQRLARRGSGPPTPVPSDDLRAPSYRYIDVGSPEAMYHEPSARDVGADAESVPFQRAAIARKFFSKKPPPIGLQDYLMRLQRYCPMSTAVYLAAGTYIHKLAVEDKVVPVTGRTIHRLVLGTLRVAMKSLEDLRYPQARFAGVGGVRETELQKLEISVCYLMDFDLQVSTESLYRKTLLLQQAAAQAAIVRQPLPPSFQPVLPPPRTAVTAS